MKVLQFTIPIAHDKSVIVQHDQMQHFYPHLHRHKEAQVTWIQEGEGTLIAGNHMHVFGPGDIFLIGPDQPHLFKSNPEYFQQGNARSVKALTIFFNPDGILHALFDLPEMRATKDFLQQYRQGFRLPEEYATKVSAIMLSVQHTSGAGEIVLFLQLLQVLQSVKPLPEPLSAPGVSKGITENEGIRISNIYNYILQRYSENITLDDVAREACMTPQAFCRYFKKHTRQTFVSFLNQMRINEACKKLTGNKYESISVVAYKCGFNSITNFNRVFKSVIGRSPREYVDNYFNKVTLG